MYSKASAARTTRMNRVIGPAGLGLGVLQHHFEDDVARVAAAVDYLFEQAVDAAQKDDLLRIVIATIKVAEEIELQLVGISFYRLEAGILFPRGGCVGAFTQFFHHGEDLLGRLVEQLDMFFKVLGLQLAGPDQDALSDFFYRLGDLVERRGESLDIFAFQRGDKRFAELFGQLLRDLFIFSPALHKLLHALRRVVVLQFGQQRDEMVDTGVRLLRAGFQQIKELLVVPEELANRKHGMPALLTSEGCDHPVK